MRIKRYQLVDCLPEEEQKSGRIAYEKIDDFTDLRTAIWHFDNGDMDQAMEYLEVFDPTLISG